MIVGQSVLVTGATGFIGGHLVRRLGAMGANVCALVRPASATGSIVRDVPRLRCWTTDLCDGDAVHECIEGVRPDLVFHLAASTRARVSQSGDPDAVRAEIESYEINVGSALNLSAALRRSGSNARMVRTGSIEEYGAGPVPFHEDQREVPVSAYAASLVAATHLLQSLHRREALRVVTIRPALVYGPGQSSRFLLPSLIRACLDNRPFDLTTGLQTRDLVYVDDVVSGLISAATAPAIDGTVVNLGSGREVRTRDVAELAARLCGSANELRFGALPDHRIGPQRMLLDTTRATRLLGWHAGTTLEQGLTKTIAAFRATDSGHAASPTVGTT